eukprot:295576-Chlamydomonas_euryale.AAC.1
MLQGLLNTILEVADVAVTSLATVGGGKPQMTRPGREVGWQARQSGGEGPGQPRQAGRWHGRPGRQGDMGAVLWGVAPPAAQNLDAFESLDQAAA